MNINIAWPSREQWVAVGRHAVSYSAGAVTGVAGILAFAVTFHMISGGQASDITSGLTHIASGVQAVVDGLTSIVGGLATLASVAVAVWSAYSASKTSASKIAAGVPGAVLVTSPAIANATPDHPNIKSNVDHVVVLATSEKG